jgi:hypothetical protein
VEEEEGPLAKDTAEATSRLSLTPSDALPSLEVDGASIYLVNSVAGVQAAVAAVLGSDGGRGGVALDLEGVDLGRTGRIATLQMCCAGGSQSSSERGGGVKATVFVVDIAALGEAAFSADETGLRSLLEGSVPKLFWDVRADAAALFGQYGVRINPDSVIDVQLLATAKAITSSATQGKYVFSLPSLGGTFDSPSSVLTFAEKQRMKSLREQARKLYVPQCGGTWNAWLARPLSPVLLEYAADARFLGRLRASLSQFEEQYSVPLKAAVQRRIALAQGPTYTNDDHGSAVESTFLVGIIDGAPVALKQRLVDARAEMERLSRLPLQQRIKQRGLQSAARREALSLLSGRHTDTGVSNSALWSTCSFVAGHDRWFDEWKTFMSAAASSALLTANQRRTMASRLASGSRPEDDTSAYPDTTYDDWGDASDDDD